MGVVGFGGDGVLRGTFSFRKRDTSVQNSSIFSRLQRPQRASQMRCATVQLPRTILDSGRRGCVIYRRYRVYMGHL